MNEILKPFEEDCAARLEREVREWRKAEDRENSSSAPSRTRANTEPPVITTVEQARAIEEDEAFRKARDSFLDYVKSKISALQNSRQQNVTDSFYMQKYKEFLTLQIADIDDFDYAVWKFNDGKLRTEDELEYAEKQYRELKAKRVRASDEYKQHHHPWRALLIPLFTLPFFEAIFLSPCSFGLLFVGYLMCFAYGCIPNLGISYLIFWLYEHLYADSYDIPVDKETIATVTAFAGAAAASYAISSRKNRKELDKTKYKEI